MLPRLVIAAASLVILAGCAGGPQQPSGEVDDKTAESPYLGRPGEYSTSGFGGVSSKTDAITTGSVATVAADMSSISGRWAPTAAECDAAGSTITISSQRFESLERTCDISDTISGGAADVTATLTCSRADGQTDTQLVKLKPVEGGLNLSFVGGDDAPKSLVRCP
jgi:hypothetical protein